MTNHKITRRLAATLLALCLAAPVGTRAEGDIYVHAGSNFKPVTIAVTPLSGDDGATKLSAIITNDFARSVFLQPIESTSFPEQVANPDVRPNVDAWKTINAQFVVTGRVDGLPAESLPVASGLAYAGYLDDVRSAIASSWCTVVPLRRGGMQFRRSRSAR